jgi:hypothetical protein
MRKASPAEPTSATGPSSQPSSATVAGKGQLAMRRLIDEVVLDDDERSLSSTMPAAAGPEQGGAGGV